MTRKVYPLVLLDDVNDSFDEFNTIEEALEAIRGIVETDTNMSIEDHRRSLKEDMVLLREGKPVRLLLKITIEEIPTC